jgi:hypothetical protein
MANKIVGQLSSWGDGDTGASDFVRLEEGSNVFRCISSPFQFYSHWVEDAAGQKRKVHCAMKDCPVCVRGDNAKPSWYVSVLNRKTGKGGIMEIGAQIFKQIKALAMKKSYGDPRGYDIDITRAPKGSQPLYSVLPEPKENLSDEDKAIAKEFLGRIDLQTMVEPPTPEAIAEKLGLEVKAKAKVAAAVEDDAPPPSDEADSDFNFDFGSK